MLLAERDLQAYVYIFKDMKSKQCELQIQIKKHSKNKVQKNNATCSENLLAKIWKEHGYICTH